MKINELREGIFDTVKQGTQSAVQQAQNFPQKLALMRKSGAINNIADVAVRAWNKKVQTLTTINDGAPIDNQKYKQELASWVDTNLIGGRRMEDLPREAQQTIVNQINKIAQNRTTPDQWKESFKDVVASGAVLSAKDTTTQIGQQVQQYPGWTYDPKDRTYNAGDLKFRADDPQQMALVKQISQKAQQT